MLVVAAPEQLPVAQARAGDPAAWDALCRRYQLPLYVYVFELVRHESTSLDLVQETFVSAVRHLGGLRADAKFGSWLFSIAHQKCLQHWRRQNRERQFVDPAGEEALADQPDATEAPGDALVRQEREEEFMTLVNQLPEPQRAVLLLHVLEDFPLEEIATVVGAPLGTVKSRLHYAKKALRALLES